MQSVACAGSLTCPQIKLQQRPAAAKRWACQAVPAKNDEGNMAMSRRALLSTTTLGVSMMGISDSSHAGVSSQAAPVGTYLPSAGVDDFVLFVPDERKTPAIRAGTVDPQNPYRFALPPTWREAKVANILSGNYCQPRCDEPWTEVIFDNADEGRAAVLASPLFKLTPKKVASITEVGSPDGVIFSVGPYITGSFLDEEDVLTSSQKTVDGDTYYYYEVFSPYARFGQHIITTAATKGEVALLFVVSASEKQWGRSEKKIRKMVETFRV